MRPLILAGAIVLGLVFAGCESERPKEIIEKPDGPTKTELEAKEMDKLLANLSKGKDLAKIEDTKIYDAAVDALIRRGSSIESTLIDNLRRSSDWSVRVGIIEVLQATGSKACIEHLIAVLNDDEALVAFRANTTLQELCQHREIPETGKPTAGNGLPPVPLRPAGDLALDAELRTWTLWHRDNKLRLQEAWKTWWTTNRENVVIR